ncbi:major histocompatibility complex class I-related gene protein-like [Boleophthalmus pectinirostris]|uniref:major histocompatibility complex class I-related gene protein-like n=1 Tax=Boleophthalmus pectinirostris TaxID=150288 RepID=UPI002430A6ED|nr:major histocompatibility complex class I-related gene protein-like [Boleophthalmus pectinirostris]
MKNIMEDQKNISTEGVVVLQASVGCETSSGSHQRHSRGRLKLQRPRGTETCLREQTEYWKHYLTEECPRWLKTLQKHGGRIEFPDIYFIDGPGTYVSCQARRFYPDKALMFWTKDGEELHEDVEYGDILPNGDGTFQTRADLDLSQVRREDWKRYKCVFELSGVRDIITILEIARQIPAEQPEDKSFLALIIILPVLLVLGGPAAVFFIDRRRRRLRNTEEPEPPDVELQLSIHQSREVLDLFKQE